MAVKQRNLICDSCDSPQVRTTTIAGGIRIHTCNNPSCGAVWGDGEDAD